MLGKCLCGQTVFELDLPKVRAYQCHCTLCRAQSGTSSNLGTIVPEAKFSWVSGRSHIKSWVKESGFTSDFCSNCGSPVPNMLRGMPYYWVPVGALIDAASVEVIAHLCTSSKATWDSIADNAVQYADLPDIKTFIHELNAE